MTETSTQETNQEALPSSWTRTTLSEIGVIASGGTPSTKEPSNFDGGIPWITPADLSGYKDKTIAQGRRNISQKALDSSSARLLPEGTVVFSSRAPVGYVVIASNSVSTNQGCKNLILSDGVFNEYVYYYLKGNKSLAESYASGTTFLELSAKAFGRLPIPLPPFNEQRRIVEKIEELFTRLDAGVRSLEQTRALLKSYRQSVLKAAVEGELSRECREAHSGEVEPASELLKRILQERREKFAGKKYKEPVPPDTSKLPVLPVGWEWADLDQLGDVTGGLTKNPKRAAHPSRFPYLRVANVYANELRLDDVAKIGVEDSELDRVLLENEDLLVVEGNGSPDQIGRVALWNGSISNCVHQNHLIKARFFQTDVSRYALYWLLSSRGREHIKRVASSTSGLYTLSISKVKALPVPVPPLEEQRFIVEEVERRLSVVDKLEETVEASLKQAGGLRQSILKRAFSGELVPQDPGDEPAGVLLERIREERLIAGQKTDKKAHRAKKEDGAQGRLI